MQKKYLDEELYSFIRTIGLSKAVALI